uniref:Short-chain dehydrogenase/reductase family protein n=1 Tax=Mycena chlorophos TaxID=658473 RepID=A0ABQ0LBS5_MYCCL|nr:short-chain dehydrogenase/reductase family protein [Mycena chlorophos]
MAVERKERETDHTLTPSLHSAQDDEPFDIVLITLGRLNTRTDERIDITREQSVERIIPVTNVESTWSKSDVAFRINLSGAPHVFEASARAKTPMNLHRIIKKQDQDSWKTGSSGHNVGDATVAGFSDDLSVLLRCKRIPAHCNGIDTCELVPDDFLADCQRLEADPQATLDLWHLHLAANEREAVSITGLLLRFYTRIMQAKCPKPGCEGSASLVLLANAPNQYGKSYYIGCSDRGNDRPLDHIWIPIPVHLDEDALDSVVPTAPGSIERRTVLITGTSLNGIGFETARVISKYANLVIITGYNDERWLSSSLSSTHRLTRIHLLSLELSEAAIKKSIPSAHIRVLKLDLSSLAAVRNAAAEVLSYPEPAIDVLINNAVAGVGPFKRSADGYELQIATAHIGHFLFTKLIAPKLLATAQTPRVVYVSSGAHAFGSGVNLETLGKPDPASYTPIGAYAEAKAAAILTAAELSRRARGKILGFSLHPGVIYTNMNMNPETIPTVQELGILDADAKPNTKDFQWKTIEQGAATTVTAAFDPRIAGMPGAYLEDSTVANEKVAAHSSDPVHLALFPVISLHGLTYSKDIARNLWNATEELLEEKFTF